MEKDELDILRNSAVPAPQDEARSRALDAAFAAYDLENTSAAAQGREAGTRLIDRARKLWRETMNRKMYATPAIAGLLALPIAGYTAYHLMLEQPFRFMPQDTVGETAKPGHAEKTTVAKPMTLHAAKKNEAAPSPLGRGVDTGLPLERGAKPDAQTTVASEQIAPLPPEPMAPRVIASQPQDGRAAGGAAAPRPAAQDQLSAVQVPADQEVQQPENRDRLQEFKANPVRSVATDPVSTFSIDVDTASYSFVRRSLKEGLLPQADTVRVEEMINYFPYDWKGPDSAATPFNATVTVMPTPWNAETRLMHVAIKGYDIAPTEKPKVNLVFLIDVSGSMDEPDKLPLLKSAFKLLVDRLGPNDTVSIVTYAGEAGTVLMPTKVSEKAKILSAIDNLAPGGSTAGAASIREAYKLAGQSFVQGGVNRVMLATDGDFNVGQTDDEDLKRLIEQNRNSGVFLSVLGFGRGNLNDHMMQTIAQNGNGTAAYIDTLAEAEKVLVEDASSTLFPIAKDVKIQVEFNPTKVAEYRLIGYETRALNREDFNNDRADAGEIGSGHAVTAIYEITPKGAPQMIDGLRYGQASTGNGGVQNPEEYAFVKIRYKAPDGDTSKLITTPVTKANEVSSFDQASVDQRFSVAVAAFGQKLRDEGQTASLGYDRIIGIANAARGSDPFGYRAEFVSLVRLAAALDSRNR
ncbi:VWA domain-containing protein [Mesorhizobium sp. BAC0120]|uniref:vWA domain-containing protein n=1 Tax=Mesorhizobium sp. BAC0120 TaxID=3090670 RepID=UPI00298CC6D5|nr:VWA domain-containing protein [Mesorhizobium sp. BAC0120]MDW6020462.1 VWA domain-containing protein [Mesorhizobium sp. BAC0120]